MVIFDKSNQSNMHYTNPKDDVTDRIIKKLGYTPGEKPEAANKEDKDDAKGGGAKGGESGGDRGGAAGKAGGNTGSTQKK